MIKEADKEGAVIIMNTSDYVAEAQRQLSNRMFYLPTDWDKTQNFTDRIETYLLSLFNRKVLSKVVYDRVTTKQPQRSTWIQRSTNPTQFWGHLQVGP